MRVRISIYQDPFIREGSKAWIFVDIGLGWWCKKKEFSIYEEPLIYKALKGMDCTWIWVGGWVLGLEGSIG